MSNIYKSSNDYILVNEFKSTRSGFNHISTLFSPDGVKISKHTCHYINRTWEPFPYYSSMLCAVDDAEEEIKNLIIDRVKTQMQIKRLTKQYKPVVEKMMAENEKLKEYEEVKNYIRRLA